MEKYLVINAGSSSLKFSLYDIDTMNVLMSGYFEKIGNKDSFYTLKINGEKEKVETYIAHHTEAVQTMIVELIENHVIEDLTEIKGVGHRVVHGGVLYKEPTMVDDTVIKEIERLAVLAPNHHMGHIAGINAVIDVAPEVPMVIVPDTAFHSTIPDENALYALPIEWYKENDVKKFGAHGTSHKYITSVMQEKLGRDDVNIIVCHIGSGASVCAVKDGLSYDTSMGLTPLAGVIMGTRSGDIDPSIINYIAHERGLTIEQIDHILNKESGLLGLSGSNDFRDVEEKANNGDEMSSLALAKFERSIINYIAQYITLLDGKVDAIIFTAGIGENSKSFRKNVLNKLCNTFGIQINDDKNDNVVGFSEITTEESRIPVYVIPTDEEYMIVKDTVNTIKTKGNILTLK